MVHFVFCVLLKSKYIALAVVVQLMEINSFFKHLQRIFQCLKVDESSQIIRTNNIFVVVTCAVFRVLLSFWLVSYVVTNRKAAPISIFLWSFFGCLYFLHQNLKMFGKAWKTAMWQERYKRREIR